MAGRPWTPVYWSDWAADTGHLSLLEEGAYACLIRHCYVKKTPKIETESALVDNNRLAYRIAKAERPDERDAVDKVLREFFVREDDGWFHKRINIELEKSKSSYEKQRLGAKKTNQKRWGGQEDNITKRQYSDTVSDTVSDAVPDTVPVSQPQPQPQPHIKKEDNKLSSKKKETSDARATHITSYFNFDERSTPETPNGKCPDEWSDYAYQKYGWTLHAIQHIFDQFCDYWRGRSGQTGRKLDWYATWRSWCSRANPPRGDATPTGQGSARRYSNRELAAMAAEELIKEDERYGQS